MARIRVGLAGQPGQILSWAGRRLWRLPRGREPAGPLEVPQLGAARAGTGLARGRRSSLMVWAAVGAAGAVATGVWADLAEHADPNVVLILLVVVVGGAEPVIRRRGGASADPAGPGPVGPRCRPSSLR
jgi:hypothetical protein